MILNRILTRDARLNEQGVTQIRSELLVEYQDGDGNKIILDTLTIPLQTSFRRVSTDRIEDVFIRQIRVRTIDEEILN